MDMRMDKEFQVVMELEKIALHWNTLEVQFDLSDLRLTILRTALAKER